MSAIIAQTDKIAFLGLSRCASASVSRAMGVRNVTSAFFKSEFKQPFFTVVRNPYSRIVSQWYDKVNGSGKKWREYFGDAWKEKGMWR